MGRISWGGTRAVGSRGPDGPYHDGVTLHSGLLGAQDEELGHHLGVLLACY